MFIVQEIINVIPFGGLPNFKFAKYKTQAIDLSREV